MILNDLTKLAQKGSQEPVFLWLEEYKEIAIKLVPDLNKIADDLDAKTEAYKNIKILVKNLEKDTPNDHDLAQALSHVADMFRENPDAENQEAINEYIRLVMKFDSLALVAEFADQSRQKLLDRLSAEEQNKYDKRLLEHEGMIYCLEYYLAMYKAIETAKTEQEKKTFIESMEVNLGFGNVPGLWIDFSKDEVLGKFIYLILNDKTRNDLIKVYFKFRNIILKIKMDCDKKRVCAADYKMVGLNEVVTEFREYVLGLLRIYHEAGVKRLASFFFKPYGDKPLIEEVIKKV
ncbi:MAG: hypothetical protein WCT11_00300 [Candidatus Magasanikbacteria bacterium]